MTQTWFIDSYYMRLSLRDENNLQWTEEFSEMSMSDIECVLDENEHEILECFIIKEVKEEKE